MRERPIDAKAPRVVLVGPSVRAKGGISTVLSNYRTTSFWKQFHCRHYPTVLDCNAAVPAALISLALLLFFPLYMAVVRPAVVGVHLSSGRSFLRKFPYLLLSRLLGRKIVLHVHPAHFADFYRRSQGWTRQAIEWAAHHSTHAVFLTPSIAQSLIPPFDAQRVSVVPNLIDVHSYSDRGHLDLSASRRVLYLGWIIPEKGVFDIVRAIPQVVARVPDVEFVFAGNKQIDELRRQVAASSAGSNVKILGWIDGDRKRAVLESTRVLLLPSYSEGVPNVLLEAMAAGIPAITTPVGGIPDIFVEGVNGYLVPPGDIDAMSKTLIKLLLDDKAWAGISARTRQHAEQYFSREVVDGLLTSVYEKVVGN